MRLTVECVDGRTSSFRYDVGPEELELLLLEHGIVKVVSWGRYAQGSWAYLSDEHRRILEALEGKK